MKRALLIILSIVCSLVFEQDPSLTSLAEKMQIPKEVLAPFLARIRDYYRLLDQAGYIKADR
ncbi:hypothetical protein ACFL1W_01435 [Candidatus Margulisiibacteriota bacterium]